MVNLLQLFYSNQMALNKFTCGCLSRAGYPCSSQPSDATNQLSAAAMESCFWKTGVMVLEIAKQLRISTVSVK